MKAENKEFTFDLLLRELEAEIDLKPKSDEAKKVEEVVKDFNQSYFKGIDRLTNYMMIDDVLKGDLK